jgi:hypothetical protein
MNALRLFLLGLLACASACVVTPRPVAVVAPVRPVAVVAPRCALGAVWIPGHIGPYGVWIPGHWRC